MISVDEGITDDNVQEGLQDLTSLWICVKRVDEIRLTPPRRARRRIAGFVMPVKTSFSLVLCFAFPNPLPLPLPDIYRRKELGVLVHTIRYRDPITRERATRA